MDPGAGPRPYKEYPVYAPAAEAVQDWVGEDRTILDDAKELVHGDRQIDYGHPLDDFERTAKIWEAILGCSVTAEQVALCMVGVKISRECNHPKRDNRVDGAGYFETLDMVQQERERRGR